MTVQSIGLLNEKPLHASLKQWYARPDDRFEVEIDGYVVDIVRDDLLIEIQTRNLASVKTKLTKLAQSHRLRLVYPIAREKRITRLPKQRSDGITHRRSPKRGRPEDLFWGMVSFPQLLANPNFSLEVLMIREEEVRRYEGKRKWRSRGWATEERRLLDVMERWLFQEPGDWRGFLPGDMYEFTARELAEKIAVSMRLAQRMAYCLRKASVVDLIGRRGRANLYRVTGT